MAKVEKKLNVFVSFSDSPENPKDIADFFIALNSIDKRQNYSKKEGEVYV